MSSTLLTNKKEGNLDYVKHAANIIKPMKTRTNCKKYTFCVMTFLEHLKGSLTRDFRLQVFFINQCPPGLWVSHWDHFEFVRKFAEIFANKCLSAVSTTPAKKDKNVEIKFFKLFCWELSLVHFTPKDWIFAYFIFLGEGKLILAGLFIRRCRWHRRKICRRCRWHRWTVFRRCRWHRQ